MQAAVVGSSSTAHAVLAQIRLAIDGVDRKTAASEPAEPASPPGGLRSSRTVPVDTGITAAHQRRPRSMNSAGDQLQPLGHLQRDRRRSSGRSDAVDGLRPHRTKADDAGYAPAAHATSPLLRQPWTRQPRRNVQTNTLNVKAELYCLYISFDFSLSIRGPLRPRWRVGIG